MSTYMPVFQFFCQISHIVSSIRVMGIFKQEQVNIKAHALHTSCISVCGVVAITDNHIWHAQYADTICRHRIPNECLVTGGR